MAGINFCPFDGKTINNKNLAYEIIHPNGWTWDRVKKETVIGTKVRNYISEEDGKRARFMSQIGLENAKMTVNQIGELDVNWAAHHADKRIAKSNKTQVMLLANPQKDGKDGLTLLCESLENEHANANGSNGKGIQILGKHYSSYEEFIKSTYGYPQGISDEKEKEEDSFSDEKGAPIKIKYVYRNNRHIFVDTNEDVVMYAIPCCPYCHNRLPLGWTDADDFMGILVQASTGEEKKDYVQSLFAQGYKRLEQIAAKKGKNVHIKDVFYEDGKADEIVPTFINVQIEDASNIMVGIYYYSNDTLLNLNLMKTPWMSVVLDKIYADFYLFHADDFTEKEFQTGKGKGSAFQKVELLSIEEQAKFQREHAGEVISAADILPSTLVTSRSQANKYVAKNSKEPLRGADDRIWAVDDRVQLVDSQGKDTDESVTEDITTLFDNLIRKRMEYGYLEIMRHMQFVGVAYTNEPDMLAEYKDMFGEDYGMGAFWYTDTGEEMDEMIGVESFVNCILNYVDNVERRG